MFDSMAWHIAKPIAALAVGGTALWGIHKLLEKADAGMTRSAEERDSNLRNVVGGSVKERIERTEHLTGKDHVTHATVLVRAFDRNGDDRLVQDEWKLQSGNDSLDGTRLFSAARHFGDRPTDAVSIDQVVATLDAFAADDFSQGWNDGKHLDAAKHYEHSLQPRDADDARQMLERGLFEKGGGLTATRSRPLEVAAAEVLARYDASGDGSISVATESTYSAGEHSSDASRFLDLADRDGSGSVDFRELRTHFASLDVFSAQGWESKPGPNGLIDGMDWDGEGLDDL